MAQNQFHHYIPRFILRNFSNETLEKERPKILLPWREILNPGQHLQTPGPLIQIPISIKVYSILGKGITLEDISRIYGVQNLYRDTAEDDSMRFERLLSQIESSSSMFVRQIVTESQDLPLTRTRLANFKKFLAIMMYRNDSRRKQYAEDSFDMMTRMSIQRHMQSNNINEIQEVWFENLKWILRTPVDEIVKEFERSGAMRNPMGVFLTYKGPIHIAELMDTSLLLTMYVCVWEAQEGSEFILSDNCFGCFEGHMGCIFHYLFVLSPKYAVVLVKRAYMWDTMKALPLRKSWFEEFHANPDVVYSKNNVRGAKDFTPGDVFKYSRIVIPRKKVWLVNSIFLDVGHKYISYKSDLAMYKSLVFYDKNKKELFENRHDYSILKRKLVAEMNRTHSG
ncbi:hypothetical protein BGZ58_010430 [Dissophora ornata]|nr:hypothetical protein BGZ58_010430 [Dissophora ornata]